MLTTALFIVEKSNILYIQKSLDHKIDYPHEGKYNSHLKILIFKTNNMRDEQGVNEDYPS